MHTSLTVLTHVLAATSSTDKKGSSIVPFLVLLGLFAVAYMVFLRPARNRQRAAIAERGKAEIGDEVITTAGLIATVVAVEDDFITLEVAPGVHCKYLPAAILRITGDDDQDAEEDEAEGAGPDLATHEVIEQPPTVTPLEPTDGTTETPGGSTSA